MAYRPGVCHMSCSFSLSGVSPALLRFIPRSLVKLDVSHNSLDSLVGLDTCPSLLELNANFNALTTTLNLTGLPRLKELRLAGNRIKAIEGLESLTQLVRLDLHQNQIADLTALRVLTYNKHLTTLDLKGNAVAKVTGFRRMVLNLLPMITNLDAIASKAEVDADVTVLSTESSSAATAVPAPQYPATTAMAQPTNTVKVCDR